jgi:ArsR family transcriptional regulator
MENATDQLILRLKALADPVRLRIVALCSNGECSVSELTTVLSLSQPRVSQHLKQLCDAGLLERFRDGHFVYYRVATGGNDAASRRRVLSLVPGRDASFESDIRALQELRVSSNSTNDDGDEPSRALHRALVALTVATPLGDLVDIGCGRGRVLKLLASRAQRAVGVDIDSDARHFARAELMLAGLPNCTLRQGNMYRLPFADGEFDTAILDDVLAESARPLSAIREAVRVTRPAGRLLLLQSIGADGADALNGRIARWCAEAGLRLAPARAIPSQRPEWLLAVATKQDAASVAA